MAAVSIDLRMIHASGIGTYARNIVPRIIAAHGETDFNLLGDLEEFKAFDWAAAKNVRQIACRAPIYSIAEQFELARRIPRDTALFWSPHYNIPLFYRGRLLVSVHDVFHLAMPRFVGGIHKRLYARGMFAAVRRKADAILTCSQFTAVELNRLAGVAPSKISVFYYGIDASWFNIPRQPRAHLKPYVLFAGNVKPNKNVGGLLDAFRTIQSKVPHDLLIVGRNEGFITGDPTLAPKMKGLEDRVKYTGHVEDAELRQFFAHADALALVSFYEGFGFPPLEAMACGCPVLVARAGSLPEVCADAALFCDPHSPRNIGENLLRLLTDAPLRERLARAGLERVRKFSWETCAAETGRVIQSLLNGTAPCPF